MTKSILVTGGSGNLGKAVVEKFTSLGYQVAATTSPGKGLGYPAAESVKTYDVDLTHEAQVNAVIGKVISENKTIDVAVLTVGGFAMGNIESTDGGSLEKMITMNFKTAYFVARPVFEQMMRQGHGRIILIGARAGLVASQGKSMVAYALSKSLLFRLAELLNAEASGKNVVTSVVVPGTIDTPVNRKSMPDADFSKWVSPEEIVENIEYLVSDAARALADPVVKLYGH